MTKRPVLRVISGNPTDAELAAILALASRARGIKEIAEPSKLNKWGDPHSHMRQHLPVGTNAWRHSAWANH